MALYTINRHVIVTLIKLNGVSEASESGYGNCISTKDEVMTNLTAVKSSFSKMYFHTFKLELCAATFPTQGLENTRDNLNIKVATENLYRIQLSR